MTKGEVLKLARILLTKIDKVRGSSAYLGEDCYDLIAELDNIEKELAKMIDDHMAAKFRETLRRRNYNKGRW